VGGVLSVLRFRDFRLLWLSQAASVMGDALILVAIGLFVTRLTGNAGDVGLVLTSYSLPLVLWLLIGGVVADRLPRQQVMVVSDAVRGTLHALLAVLIATGAVQIWQMMVIGVLFGTAEAFFRPAYTGLVPQTVPEDQIQRAQALGGLSVELATFLSPAIATALVLSVGGAAAFGLDALTFAVSAIILSRVRGRQRGTPSERTTVVTELREGWSAVRERTWVGGTIAAFSGSLLLGLAPFVVLGASVSTSVYGTSAVYGWASAAWGAGTMTGALAGSAWRPARPMLTGTLACIPWPALVVVFALGPPLGVLYAVAAGGGVGIGLFTVWWETALAERIPPHLLSRVSAWDWMGSLALLPLGYLLAGPVAEQVGAVRTMVVGGLLAVVSMALGLLPRSTRTLARLPAPAAAPVAAAAAAMSLRGS